MDTVFDLYGVHFRSMGEEIGEGYYVATSHTVYGHHLYGVDMT